MKCVFQLDMAAWIPPGDLVLPGSHTGLLVVALHRPTLYHLSRWSFLLHPVPNQSVHRSLALQLKYARHLVPSQRFTSVLWSEPLSLAWIFTTAILPGFPVWVLAS